LFFHYNPFEHLRQHLKAKILQILLVIDFCRQSDIVHKSNQPILIGKELTVCLALADFSFLPEQKTIRKITRFLKFFSKKGASQVFLAG